MSAAVAELRPYGEIVSPDTFGLPLSKPDLPLDPKILLQQFPYEELQRYNDLSYEEVVSLKPGFRIVGDNEMDASPTKASRGESERYDVGFFSTDNGLQWQVFLGTNNGRTRLPMLKNFPPSEHPTLPTDLAPLLSALEAKQLPPKEKYNRYEMQHALVEHVIDENIFEWLELFTGKEFQGDEKVFVAKEPHFGSYGTPDWVAVWPRVGIFSIDISQRRRSRISTKNDQLDNHMQGIRNLVRDLYGDRPRPRIISTIIKFYLAGDTKQLVVHPHIERKQPLAEVA